MASKKRTASTSLQSQSHVGAVSGDDQVDCETVNVENNDSGSDESNEFSENMQDIHGSKGLLSCQPNSSSSSSSSKKLNII
ncbi:hypothetical protein OUZ56_033466 [Daphnia magna]|uniref:Uncharacterized protein n=1 Tax=Daphnia magna TaxID=35525 RepID=A0ABQ9ZXX4_9CRUS|nr:hypothetical protein OUZ56_033466 [Daphnia magna]